MRWPKLCTHLNYLQTPVSVYLPQQNLKAPLKGGTHKITFCLIRWKKKNLSFSCSASMARFNRDNFQSTGQDNVRSIQPCFQIVGVDKHPQKTSLISPAPKISILTTSQISKPVPKVLTTDMWHFRKIPPLSKISKISNRNSNLQLSPAKALLTSYYKFSFIKNIVNNKISLQNIVYYGCQSCARYNPLSTQQPSAFPLLCHQLA